MSSQRISDQMYWLPLATTMTGHSVAHVRALMSCIFAHAVADGRVDSNPIRDASLRVKPKASKGTPHYTPAEMLAILKALANHPRAQVAMALGFFAGLPTAETAGLQWGDISDDWSTITVQRSVGRGQAAECKTETSKAPIPLIEPLRSLLQNFKASHTVMAAEQHILVNSLLRPFDLAGLAHRIIRPTLADWQTRVERLLGWAPRPCYTVSRHKPTGCNGHAQTRDFEHGSRLLHQGHSGRDA